MANRGRFSSFNQPVKCRVCGKLTTESVNGALGLALCGPCQDEAGLENEHADGHHEIVQCAACPDCAVAISWLVQVGAVVATGASGVDVSFVLRIEEEEYEGTATLIPRRDGRQGYEAAGSSPDYWLDVAFWSRFRSLTDAHSRYREIERDVLQAIAGECAVVAGAAAS